MLTYKTQRASLFTYTIFEKMVPNDKLSKLDSLLDFSIIYEKAKKYCCPDNGRPSYDPVVMFNILFLGFLYNISGEQNLLDEVSDRASFRQFAGLDLTDDIPDRTTLVKFRMKLGLGLIQDFFDQVLQQCINLNLVGFQNSVFDGTIVKARARFITREGKTTLGYQAGYKTDVKEGIITDVVTIPANQDIAQEYYQILTTKSQDEQITADREFYENRILKYCDDNNIKCNIPIKTNLPANRVLDKSHFKYHKRKDYYLCPQGKILRRVQQHRKQQQVFYRASPKDCKRCPIKEKCTTAKQRNISRSFYEELNQKHKAYTKTPDYFKAQILRKIIGEGKFNEAKNHYGLKLARYVGLTMMKLQVFFTACIQNCMRLLRIVTTRGTI